MQAEKMASDGPELLPGDVKPSNYNVRLTPSFDDFTFDGTVDIQITVRCNQNPKSSAQHIRRLQPECTGMRACLSLCPHRSLYGHHVHGTVMSILEQIWSRRPKTGSKTRREQEQALTEA